MLRRYKYVRTTETIEREIVPRKRPQMRIKIIEHEVVPVRRPTGPTKTVERELAPPGGTGIMLRWPRWQPKLKPLALGSLTLAILGGLSVVMMALLACAIAGYWTWSTPNQGTSVARRPQMIRSRLATLTPTPLAVAEVMEVPEVSASPVSVAVDPTTPIVPTAHPTPSPPTVATSQVVSKPKLTSRVVLNVRAGPGVAHPVVGKLSAGQSATITGQNPEGTWWQIEYAAASGGLAWVSADPQYSTVSQTQPLMVAQGPTPTTSAAAPVTTPLVSPTAAPAGPSGTPTTSATPSSGTTPTGSPTPPGDGGSGEWLFAATRIDAIPARKMLMLFGELVNETGAAQQLSTISGTFYDPQGQVIAADKSTYGLWPTNVVPPGGRVPFALTVYDIQEAVTFDLTVQAKAVETAPRQDFEFVGVSEAMKGNNYCLSGALKNPGPNLEKQLVVAAILYDEQGSVLRFGNNNKIAFQDVVGDQTADFEVCIKSPPDNVASHELLAWGI